MSSYKVLVVDDSAFMRKMISDIISEDADFHVIHAAKNGAEAIEMVKVLRPDVITMDIDMPVMNGLEALKVIMNKFPTPVVMLSSLTVEGGDETVQALEIGAVDFIHKPSGSISLDLHLVKINLLEKLRIAVQTNLKSYSQVPPIVIDPINRSSVIMKNRFEHIVTVGTSTGGPKALHILITQLPKSFPAPILIVQHMPPKFTKSLADRLNSVSQLAVVEAEDGCVIQAGTVYIAPGGKHMKLIKEGMSTYKIRLTHDEPRQGHRPSVDTLFESMVDHNQLKRHVIVMTGMGNDGAKSMKLLKESGAESTIAESEETCVVYGMPRAAIELMKVDYILPLHQIPAKLLNLVSTS